MALYGGPTPKRHVCWANSPAIQRLHVGPLQGWAQKVKADEASGKSRRKTVKKYVNKEGKACYKGDSGLKPSESKAHFDKARIMYYVSLLVEKCSSSGMAALTFGDFSAFLRNYPRAFGVKFASLYHDLNKNKFGLPALPKHLPPAEESFAEMTFDDVWQDAQVVNLCHWLRGGRDLQIPDSFRNLIPKKL